MDQVGKHITFVSFFFDINRVKVEKLASFETYINWIEKLLNLNINIYFFTTADLYDKLKFIPRANLKFKIVPEQARLDLLPKIRETWVNFNTNNPEKDTPEFALLMHNKFYYMLEAMEDNPFDDKYYAWIDSGIMKVITHEKLLENLTPSDKCKFMMMNYVSKQEIENLKFVRTCQYKIAGGFFTGNRENLSKFSQCFLHEADEYLNKGEFGQEQEFITLSYFKNKDICQLYYGDYCDLIRNYDKCDNTLWLVKRIFDKAKENNDDYEAVSVAKYLLQSDNLDILRRSEIEAYLNIDKNWMDIAIYRKRILFPEIKQINFSLIKTANGYSGLTRVSNEHENRTICPLSDNYIYSFDMNFDFEISNVKKLEDNTGRKTYVNWTTGLEDPRIYSDSFFLAVTCDTNNKWKPQVSLVTFDKNNSSILSVTECKIDNYPLKIEKNWLILEENQGDCLVLHSVFPFRFMRLDLKTGEAKIIKEYNINGYNIIAHNGACVKINNKYLVTARVKSGHKYSYSLWLLINSDTLEFIGVSKPFRFIDKGIDYVTYEMCTSINTDNKDLVCSLTYHDTYSEIVKYRIRDVLNLVSRYNRLVILNCPEIGLPEVLYSVFTDLFQGLVDDDGYETKIIHNLSEIRNSDIVFMGDKNVSSEAGNLLNKQAPDAIYIGWYWNKQNTSMLKHFIYTGENILTPTGYQVERCNFHASVKNYVPLLLRANDSPDKIGKYEKTEENDYCFIGGGYRSDWVPGAPFKGEYHYVHFGSYFSAAERRNKYLKSKFCLGFQSDENIVNSHVSQRIFESMAYGCLVLTESAPAVQQTENIAILVKSKEDLIDKMNYYNNHPEETAIIREKGYEFIRRKGTNRYAMKLFQDKIKELYNIEL